MKQTFRRFWPYIKGYKGYYFIVLIGIIMTVLATVATAQIMQPLMDKMFIEKDPQMLYYIPLMMIGIYVVKSVGRYLQAVFMNYIGQHIITRLRSQLLDHMLHLDMAFLHANRSGELISRITNDINRVQYFVSNMLPELVRESLTALGLIVYVIYLNAELAFYSLVVLPLAIYPLILIAKRLRRLSHRSQEKNADVVTRLTEVFNNAEIIKANGTEAYEMGRFDAENNKFFKLNMKAVYTNEIVSPMMEVLGATGLAAVIFIAGQQVFNNQMTVGEFTAFLTAVGLTFQPLRRVSSIYGKIQNAIAASERIFSVLDRESMIEEGSALLEEPIREIGFSHVALDYGETHALRDVSLSIHPSEQIALVGDSGGGKSSLVNLLLRFYDPSEGELRINGRDVREYDHRSLLKQMAVVSQRVYVMQDSLAENVAYGLELDEARVIEALKLADAYDFAQGLPEGIHTLMEEGGANLSGGQRQRIAIARAIYKNASVLILDEATSALDNESELRIQKALASYTKDKITIMIAHRLTTVEHADRLYFFKAGEITDAGSFAELMERSEDFQRIARSYEG
ncbi:ABC transporter ATP-binding protein [Sulfurimonas diazotrophicus]|uniref:ABC transporter transmembrane domain-containing protein n=1 Tax=Sulfurimonas diazotrophicus TaxID=3131939 RepID=A0ABZ3H9I1_9BACT